MTNIEQLAAQLRRMEQRLANLERPNRLDRSSVQVWTNASDPEATEPVGVNLSVGASLFTGIEASVDATEALSRVATRARTYNQDAAPVDDDPYNPIPQGSIWYDTNDGNQQYRWDGTSWAQLILGKVQSSNFVAGSSGWRLTPEGVAEVNDLIARGDLLYYLDAEEKSLIEYLFFADQLHKDVTHQLDTNATVSSLSYGMINTNWYHDFTVISQGFPRVITSRGVRDARVTVHLDVQKTNATNGILEVRLMQQDPGGSAFEVANDHLIWNPITNGSRAPIAKTWPVTFQISSTGTTRVWPEAHIAASTAGATYLVYSIHSVLTATEVHEFHH